MYFPQVHPPGREAQFDFTHCGELKVTIAGQSYPHLLFQLILSHSGWRYAEVAAGETFLALQQGLQNALWTLGGVPEVVRSDNTAAATHELRSSRGRALNDNYAALLDHYSLRSTRINPGQSHENGVAEHAHYRLKDAIDQALILRGSRDFRHCRRLRQLRPADGGETQSPGRWEAGAGDALPGTPAASSGAGNTSTTSPRCASGAPSR